MTGVAPYKIDGPALISFSGGRTSGYMLWHILQANGGALPDDVHVTFANTGREMPETLDFVRDCGERWGIEIVWLEYRDAEKPADRWQRVSHETAARNGEPFKALIDKRGYLPNPVTRFCTLDLKINAIQRWARAAGIGDCDRVLGIRADERHRLVRVRVRVREQAGKDAWEVQAPMVEAGVTKRDVAAFWARQNFDLELPNVGGRTPLGNCDLCFLKSAATISAIMVARPSRAHWWIEAEARARASKPNGARFRSDRPNYAALFQATKDQTPFDFGDIDEINDCFCGEAA